MPKDNIKRAIVRGTGEGGEGADLEAITYEGYGPGGAAILVDVLTDNKNRSLAEVKHAFSRAGGNLASAGSVAWQFEQKGYIVLGAEGVEFDEVFMVAAEAGAEDIEEEEESINIYTPREEAARVASALREAGYQLQEFDLTWVAKNEISLSTAETLKAMSLIEKLEELDDVESVASNVEITDEALASLTA